MNRNVLHLRLVLASALLLTGCAVGPTFVKPVPPQHGGYGARPQPATVGAPGVAGGEAQHFVDGLDLPGEWWSLFHCKPLNDWVERALKANPDLKAAAAALVVARENTLAQKGGYYPSVSAGLGASRNKTPGSLSPTPSSGAYYYNLYTPQVNVSFVPDVFGLNRRTVESLKAQEDQARFALAATHITLSSNVVAAAIQDASLRAQLAATRELIQANQAMLDLLKAQFAQGYASRLDLAAQETQLAQAAATLPPLLKQQAQNRDLLAALAGGFPNEDRAGAFELSALTLPRDLPLSLPSRLVEQRPDVRQAEENLHAASAQIGVAEANRLPSFVLTADVGSMALLFNQLFRSGTGFWAVGLGATQPLFQGGTLLHRQRAAEAAYTQAAEQYRSTVLTAFQNVADTLAALQQDGAALKAAAEARDAAAVTLKLSRQQYDLGYLGFLGYLNVQQAYQQAVLALVQAQASRFTDTAALFQALGGGWWHRADLPRT
jgi:NodT family efflux transporter outer membrane factor (OMF) lipoprotein